MYNPYADCPPLKKDTGYVRYGNPKPPHSGGGFLSGFKFPGLKDLDTGDIILLAVLFLLYRESKDEEFLILLAFFAYLIITEK